MKKLSELLDQYSYEILTIKKRLYLIKSIDKKLRDCADQESLTLTLKNYQVCEIVRDSYHMLVIDLCSYCKNFVERGGLWR